MKDKFRTAFLMQAYNLAKLSINFLYQIPRIFSESFNHSETIVSINLGQTNGLPGILAAFERQQLHS